MSDAVENLSEHAKLNRHHWGKQADWYREPGRRSWEASEPTWGIWELPEVDVQALGDMSRFSGKDVIELGCGTAYFGAWFAKSGAHVTGIDVTPEQLGNARAFQQEFGIEFPLIEGSAESVPLPDASFDVAFSEYGASLWCEPNAWLSEASRLLRPGGELIFLTNSPLVIACSPLNGSAATAELHRPLFGMHQVTFPDEGTEFHLSHGEMFRTLRKHGFSVDNLIELQAPAGATSRYDFVTAEWAHKWPTEEIWCARK